MSRQQAVRRARGSVSRRLAQVESLGSVTESGFDKYFLRRLDHLKAVRGFVIGWVGLILVLITGLVVQNVVLGNYYQTLRAVPGGIYKEGVLGTFTNANPIFAVNDADSTVSHLIFAGLFKNNERGAVVGDLASGFNVDARGTTYTVKLKPHLTWQDGQPLTSNDVVFTYQLIQNPDAGSPLQSGWRDVKLSAPDPSTIVFSLPSPLASFIYSLNTGIVPQHLLAAVPPVDLRSSDFNTLRPVGAGPFKWHAIQASSDDPAVIQQQIALVPFDKYQAGKPKVDEFVVHTYAAEKPLLAAFADKQLTAASGLSAVPKKLQQDAATVKHNFLLRAATMTFFKMTNPILADQKVRMSLIQAVNTPDILSQLGYQTQAVNEPFLNNQFTYDPKYAEPSFDRKAAQDALTNDGWQVGTDGVRTKGKTRLSFSLTAANTPEFRTVSRQLVSQWRSIGVDVTIQLQNAAEFQTSLQAHNYDALLYGIDIGSDPDVFVYWHSSQADVRSPQRLNFSEFKNTTADLALEAGRTRLDPALRAVKYRPFLQAWQESSPALSLYQPRYLYMTNGQVTGLNNFAINTPTDRFINIQSWEIRQARVTN